MRFSENKNLNKKPIIHRTGKKDESAVLWTEIKNRAGRLSIEILVFILFIISFSCVFCQGIDFKDEYPTTEWQNRTQIDCYVTVYSTVADNIDLESARYSISNDGMEKFGSWRYDLEEYTEIDSYEARLKASIPNQDDDTFKQGDNNYIRWGCSSKNGVYQEATYKINILENQPPVLKIIQPPDRGDAGLPPVIEAEAYDEGMGISTDSINIEIKDDNDQEILNITGSNYPDIYDPLEETIYYECSDSIFKKDKTYTLTIGVEDTGYNQSLKTTKTVTFSTKDRLITQVSNCPNPFDPKHGTTIRYILRESAEVTINIYDTAHRLVRTVVKKEKRNKGLNKDLWYGRNFADSNLANGIYYCEIKTISPEKQRAYHPIAILGR
ncbi:MAG: hypothetical protein ACOC5R_04925 [Elusimicrobiota bacterium]